jgi:ketol-acid reductoisomerase
VCRSKADNTLSLDYMLSTCSATARRGAIDWSPIFERTNQPIFEALYESIRNGTETRRSLEFNSRPTYRQDLADELNAIDEQEMWRVGRAVRALRPERKE